MKLYKSSILALSTVIAASFMTACSDDDTVNVVGADGPGAYFDSTQATNISLDEDATSVAIHLERSDSAEPLTVKLTATNPDDAFQIPSTVTFAAGEKTADINIGYVSSNLVYDQDYKVTIDLTEGAYKYADSSRTFTFTLPGHWTEWMPAPNNGTCDYTYSLYLSGYDPGLPAYYRISNDDANIEQYRIDEWFYGVSLYIELDRSTNTCSVPSVYTGYDSEQYGPVYVTDCYNYGLMRGRDDAESLKGLSTYDPETGLFSLNLSYYVGAGGFSYGADKFEYLQLNGFADYSMSLSQRGNYVENGTEYAVVYVFKGADIESYKYTIAQGELTEDEVAEAVEALEADEEADVRTESGYLAFPLTEKGKYTVIVAGYVGKDVKTVESTVIKFESVQGADTWTDLGWVEYTDGFLNTFFEIDNVTYYVPIQEDSENPGSYRLVNPYGEYYPYCEEGDYDPNAMTYLYVNASDASAAYVDYSESATDFGYGNFLFWSYAGYYMENGYTLDQVKGAGMTGTLTGGKITFPNGALLVGMADYKDGALYDSNLAADEDAAIGPFCIDLNTLTSSQPSSAPRKAAMLKGHKPTLKSGIKMPKKGMRHHAGRALDAEVYLRVRTHTLI